MTVDAAVPFEEDPKDPTIWFLDHNFHESMYTMQLKINGADVGCVVTWQIRILFRCQIVEFCYRRLQLVRRSWDGTAQDQRFVQQTSVG